MLVTYYRLKSAFCAYLRANKYTIFVLISVLIVTHSLQFYFSDVDIAGSNCVYFSESPDGHDLRKQFLETKALYSDKLIKHMPLHGKYIASSTCAGFGNQLFVYAAIYALGRKTNREPFFRLESECQLELEAETYDSFYEFHSRMHFFSSFTAQSKKMYYFADCCKYVMPEDIMERKEHMINLQGAMQNYRYFHEYRQELSEIFKCNEELVHEIKIYNENLMGKDNLNNSNHRKICAHSRLGDFVPANAATSHNFTVEAVDKIIEGELKNNSQATFSVLLLGIDKFFLESVKRVKEAEKKENVQAAYYVPKSRTRSADMCYGMHSCDIVLITASSSTYSWWLGYLSNATVYYNARRARPDYYLHEWIPITIASEMARPL